MPQLQPARELERVSSAAAVPSALLWWCTPRQWLGRVRSIRVTVWMWLAVSVYFVIAQVFSSLTNGVGPHTGERRLKYGHNFAQTLYMCRQAHADLAGKEGEAPARAVIALRISIKTPPPAKLHGCTGGCKCEGGYKNAFS